MLNFIFEICNFPNLLNVQERRTDNPTEELLPRYQERNPFIPRTFNPFANRNPFLPRAFNPFAGLQVLQDFMTTPRHHNAFINKHRRQHQEMLEGLHRGVLNRQEEQRRRQEDLLKRHHAFLGSQDDTEDLTGEFEETLDDGSKIFVRHYVIDNDNNPLTATMRKVTQDITSFADSLLRLLGREDIIDNLNDNDEEKIIVKEDNDNNDNDFDTISSEDEGPERMENTKKEINLDEPQDIDKAIAPEEIETSDEETRQIPLGLGSLLTAMFLDDTETDKVVNDNQMPDELEAFEDQEDALNAGPEPVDEPLEDIEKSINKEDNLTTDDEPNDAPDADTIIPDFDYLIELIVEEPLSDEQDITDDMLQVEKEVDNTKDIDAAEIMNEILGIATEPSKKETYIVTDVVLQSKKEDNTEDIDDFDILEDSAALEPLDDLKAEALAQKLVEGGKVTAKGDNQIITNEVIR